MGAAELAGLLRDYHGSYLLVFAGYNAGHGQVEKWIEGYGDPRDPKIDPIHWVERIPFAETRNYFQRVMENLRAYSAVRQRYAVATSGENVKLISVFLEGRFVRVWSWCATGVVGTAPSSANW